MDQKTSHLPLIIGGVIVLILVAFGAHAFMQDSAPAKEDMMLKEGSAMEDEGANDMMPKDDSTMGDTDMMKDDMSSEKETDGMMQKGSYEAYSSDKLALADSGDVVLFFHASWCPSCRGLNADIEEHLGSIPEGVTILKVDYDSETELKKKYGVTTQHTLVQVASDGSLLKKWSGSPTLARVVLEII